MPVRMMTKKIEGNFPEDSSTDSSNEFTSCGNGIMTIDAPEPPNVWRSGYLSTDIDGMTALTKEERENRKNILERISERMIPVSVIEDIKKKIDKEYKWLMSTKHSLYDIDIAFDRIKSLIDKHISEKEKE